MIALLPPAEVEVDSRRQYVSVNDSACALLGYTRQELLAMRIDDISFPSGAHAVPMFQQFVKDGTMHGIYAVQRKSGEVLRIRFQSELSDGRSRAMWTHYEVWENPHLSRIG